MQHRIYEWGQTNQMRCMPIFDPAGRACDRFTVTLPPDQAHTAGDGRPTIERARAEAKVTRSSRLVTSSRRDLSAQNSYTRRSPSKNGTDKHSCLDFPTQQLTVSGVAGSCASLLPVAILSGLRWIRIFNILEPEPKPVDASALRSQSLARIE